MTKFMNIFQPFLVCCLFLFGACTAEKEHAPIKGGNYKPENSDLVGFEGTAEPIDCGKNLVRRFIEIPQSNWGRTDAG